MNTTFETPSSYIPAGARFNGAGFNGVEALFAAADEAGVRWSAAVHGAHAWAELEDWVHSRTVAERTVWGLWVSTYWVVYEMERGEAFTTLADAVAEACIAGDGRWIEDSEGYRYNLDGTP